MHGIAVTNTIRGLTCPICRESAIREPSVSGFCDSGVQKSCDQGIQSRVGDTGNIGATALRQRIGEHRSNESSRRCRTRQETHELLRTVNLGGFQETSVFRAGR